MITADILVWISRGLFIILGIFTSLQYLRTRNQLRMDIALAMNSLSLIILIQVMNILFEGLPEWLGLISVSSFVAQPYLLFRLARHFRKLPKIANTLILAFMIVCFASILFVNVLPSAILTTLILSYFILAEGFCAWIFLSTARKSFGVRRPRMILAASGAGLLTGTILILSMTQLAPSPSPVLQSTSQDLVLLAGLSLYLAFLPPRWLQRSWQMTEVERYMGDLQKRPLATSEFESFEFLRSTAIQITGAEHVVILSLDSSDDTFKALDPSQFPDDPKPLGANSVLASVWQARKSLIVSRQESAGEGLNWLRDQFSTDTILLVPLLSPQKPLGILAGFLQSGSIFLEESLEILTILSQHSSILHAYSNLLEVDEERLRQIETVNKELETFSYSVSHDLRAPLRAINGFSMALMEDTGDDLPPEAQDHLNRIRNASQRMGDLIDDLLALSRVSRAEMRKDLVALDELARQIIREWKPEEVRQVKIAIDPVPAVVGDPGLLRILLENLIGNALKFTSKNNMAQIHFSADQDQNRIVYWLKDNGVGFDMRYADKLFGAFQRLHDSNEFGGTGIGLATVQRIVHRHGGEVWVEAELGRGARFFFTLANSQGAYSENV